MGRLELLRTSSGQSWRARGTPGAASAGTSSTYRCCWNLRKCGPSVQLMLSTHVNGNFHELRCPYVTLLMTSFKGLEEQKYKIVYDLGRGYHVLITQRGRELHYARGMDCFFCSARISSNEPQKVWKKKSYFRKIPQIWFRCIWPCTAFHIQTSKYILDEVFVEAIMFPS